MLSLLLGLSFASTSPYELSVGLGAAPVLDKGIEVGLGAEIGAARFFGEKGIHGIRLSYEQPLARRRGWGLVGTTRAECAPGRSRPRPAFAVTGDQWGPAGCRNKSLGNQV